MPASAASSVGSSGRPAARAMIANSVSLGTIQSLTSASSGAIGAPGAGLRIVVAPRARAARKAAVVTAWSISNWAMTASTRAWAATAAAPCSGSSPLLAPGMMMIRLLPSASTQMGATPLAPGTRRTYVASMP